MIETSFLYKCTRFASYVATPSPPPPPPIQRKKSCYEWHWLPTESKKEDQNGQSFWKNSFFFFFFFLGGGVVSQIFSFWEKKKTFSLYEQKIK